MTDIKQKMEQKKKERINCHVILSFSLFIFFRISFAPFNRIIIGKIFWH